MTKKWESRLYTPRPLIRKPKVYTTRAKKRNYETRALTRPRKSAATVTDSPRLRIKLRRGKRLCSKAAAAFTNTDTRRDTRAAARTGRFRFRSPGTRRFFLRNCGSRFFRCRDKGCSRD